MKLNIKNGIIQNDNILGTPFKRCIVPFVTRRHRPGTKSNKTSITIHNTDNTLITATAENHRILLTNLEKEKTNTSLSKNQVSWHFVIDDIQIIQNIPIDEVSHCQGHQKGNVSSISIEICDNYYNYDRKKYLRAEDNAAKLAGSLLETLGINTIYQHYNWTGKNCPSKIRRENRWNSYVSKINSYKGQSSISGKPGLPGPVEPPKKVNDFEGDINVKANQTFVIACDKDKMNLIGELVNAGFERSNKAYKNVVVLQNENSQIKPYIKCPYRIAICSTAKEISSYCNYAIIGTNEDIKKGITEFAKGANKKFAASNFKENKI